MQSDDELADGGQTLVRQELSLPSRSTAFARSRSSTFATSVAWDASRRARWACRMLAITIVMAGMF